MMDHRNEPDNSDRDRDLPEQSNRSESSPASDASTSGYYYDDSTGYEVYDDEDECEEE
jgi:hypothetical protein